MQCPRTSLHVVETQHFAAQQIDELFARCPDLCGFSVQTKLSDTGHDPHEEELIVTAVGISPRINAEQYGEIFGEIATTLSELLDEHPDSCDFLRGRTFARALH
jgi:hypothetical protein